MNSQNNLNDVKPPQDKDLERVVLGELMLYVSMDELYQDIEDKLISDLFYSPSHSMIYSTILDMHSHNNNIEYITLSNELNKRGLLEKCGGRATIKSISEETKSSAFLKHHLEMLRKLALRRKQLLLSATIAIKAKNDSVEPGETLDIIEEGVKVLREDYLFGKKRNLSDEIREWIKVTTGNFLVTDYYKEANIVTPSNKKAALMAMGRLVKEGVIERHGDKRGCYRLIDKDLELMDVVNAKEEILPIKLPFEIEKWVNICPRNIILVAGESNSGKSAFLLNVAKMNMGNFNVNYFNSEMGDSELNKRLRMFDDLLPEHWNVKFYERSMNFADVIKPNDLNIIDFMEIYDDFWMAGGWIRDIWNKLNRGVAVIAIQKDPDKLYGRGGNLTTEKPRLYVTMKYVKEKKYGELEIIKGKNHATEINPNGMKMKYTLFHGSKFRYSDWEIPA